MRKQIKMVVACCGECPYLYVKDAVIVAGPKHMGLVFNEAKCKLKHLKEIESTQTMPAWCPLEDLGKTNADVLEEKSS